MRQAGRYLPEYRELRQRHAFQAAVSDPGIAVEITLQPIRRFAMDGAVIFADIMTPLEAMGVPVTFDPGPRLRPHTVAEVAGLGALDPGRVEHVAATVAGVRAQVPEDTAVIGFAGAPVTLLAYLLEGGGSTGFMALRAAVAEDPAAVAAALATLAAAMNRYLQVQVGAGAAVVQLFDTWAGLLARHQFEALAIPAARKTLDGLDVPSIYFAPGAGHALDLFPEVAATGYGVDWRVAIDDAWEVLGEVAVQGNLDPAVLLTDRVTVTRAVGDIMDRVGGRPGHVFNLGHGIDRATSPDLVAAMVEAVRDR
jgi:uroporphyrinogen decarboxylase